MKIAIFGAGITGKSLGDLLIKMGFQIDFLDNDLLKQTMSYNGARIWNPKEYIDTHSDYKVIVTCAKKNQPEIKAQLQLLGVNDNDCYIYSFFIEQILPILVYEQYNQIFMSLCQITLTERCTLKCKKCAHACHMVGSNAVDLTLKEVKHSADAFFEKIDMVNEFVLIGGEPMLYKDLDEAIKYIGEKYRSHINSFFITTNGTIIPPKSTLELCRKYNVSFDISNYSKTIPRLTIKYDELVEKLVKNEVAYTISGLEREWMDYGFDEVNRNASPDELKDVFAACHTPCHEVRGSRLYYCVMARAVSENMGFGVGKDDYLDLSLLEGESGKQKLLKFILGDIEKGYLEMCNYCRGAEAALYPIPPAVQVEK